MTTTDAQNARGIIPMVAAGPAVTFGLDRPRSLLEQLGSYLDSTDLRDLPATMKLMCGCGVTKVTVEPGETAQSLLAKVKARRAAKLPGCPHTDRP